MGKNISYSVDLPQTVHSLVTAKLIPAFYTKREALKVGKEYGWNSAVKFECRFETIWVIGTKSKKKEKTLLSEAIIYRLPEVLRKPVGFGEMKVHELAQWGNT